MRRFSLACAASFFVCFQGCASLAPLDGSLTGVMDITYDRSVLSLEPGSLALRFMKARDTQWDTVLKIAVALENGEQAKAGSVFDLTKSLSGGGQMGSVTRNVLDDKITVLPLILSGTLTLTNAPIVGQIAKGSFTITFVQGSDAASGKAVFGPFEAEVATK